MHTGTWDQPSDQGYVPASERARAGAPISPQQQFGTGNASSGSPKTAESRISAYKRQSSVSDQGEVAPTGDKLTGPQRRRAIHKAGGYGPGGPSYGHPDPERENLTDPDRWTTSKSGKHAYMNPVQFHKLDSVRDYNAMDGYSTGHDLIPGKMQEIARGKGDTAQHMEGTSYDDLEDAMKRGGPAGGKVPPILLQGGPGHDGGGGYSHPTIRNGGHRLALADKLGWKVIPVTREKDSSGYNDARFPYHGGGGDSEYGSSYNQGSSYRSDDEDPSSAGPGTRDTPARYRTGARSHVPGDPQGGKGQQGANWHAGKTHGLYTELHGPALPTYSAKQFGMQQEFKDRIDQLDKGQQILPGMENTMHVGRSKYDGDVHWKGGAATGAAIGMGRARPSEPGPVTQGHIDMAIKSYQNGHPTGAKGHIADAAARRQTGFREGVMPQESVHKFGAPKSPQGGHADGPDTRNVLNALGGGPKPPPAREQTSGSAPHGRWPGGGRIMTGDL
jgi:hypothetical protein